MITDFGRWEDGSLKKRAGEEIVRYFKNKDPTFRDIQILVCSVAVGRTGFVESFPSTYSTKSRKVVIEFIQSLAQGVNWTPAVRWAIP